MERSLTGCKRGNRYRLIKRIFEAFHGRISASTGCQLPAGRYLKYSIDRQTFPLRCARLPSESCPRDPASISFTAPSLSLRFASLRLSWLTRILREGGKRPFSRGPYVCAPFVEEASIARDGNTYSLLHRKIEKFPFGGADGCKLGAGSRGGERRGAITEERTPAASRCPSTRSSSFCLSKIARRRSMDPSIRRFGESHRAPSRRTNDSVPRAYRAGKNCAGDGYRFVHW